MTTKHKKNEPEPSSSPMTRARKLTKAKATPSTKPSKNFHSEQQPKHQPNHHQQKHQQKYATKQRKEKWFET